MGGAFAAGDGGEPEAAGEEPATRFALGKTLGINRLRLLEATGGGMWGGYSDPFFMEQWVLIEPERFGR